MTAEKKEFVVTANPELFMLGRKNKQVHKMLVDRQTTIVPDGIGLVCAGRILGYPVRERIPGVEVSEKLLQMAEQYGKKVALFGSKKEVMERLKERLERVYPNLQVCYTSDGYVDDKEKVMREILLAEPDVILVALGMPQQELLIHQFFPAAKKGIFVGVGGTFDVLSGSKKRAPQFFVKYNLEWLYRITSEPSRLKRFWDNNIKFVFYVVANYAKLRES